jgi:valyl-tRNA synthetase
MVAAYPRTDESLIANDAEEEIRVVLDLIRAVRNTRAELKIEPNRPVEVIVDAGGSFAAIESETEAIRALARVEPLTLLRKNEERPAPQEVRTTVLGEVTVMLPLAGLIDSAAEKDRLQGELDDARSRAASLGERLANEAFRSRAPATVVEKEETRLAETRQRMTRLEEELARLTG